MKYSTEMLRQGRDIFRGMHKDTELDAGVLADHSGLLVIVPDDYPEENYFEYWCGLPVQIIKRQDLDNRPPLIAFVPPDFVD